MKISAKYCKKFDFFKKYGIIYIVDVIYKFIFKLKGGILQWQKKN